MKRGEIYLVETLPGDPKPRRPVAIVSRQALIDSRHPTVVCAPIGSTIRGIATEVPVGPSDGLKGVSAIHCDELISLPKRRLSNYVGSLNAGQMEALDVALALALDLAPPVPGEY